MENSNFNHISKLLELLLVLFVVRIKRQEIVFKSHFKIKGLPYLEAGKSFPKKGIFLSNKERVEYKFHGSGCTFTYPSGVIIDFDVAPISDHNIKISPWKFLRYIQSLGVKHLENLDEKQTTLFLENQEKSGRLKKTLSLFFSYEVIEENELFFNYLPIVEAYTSPR